MASAERSKQWAEESRDSWRKSSETNARRLSAQRGVTTRIKNRVKHGVCPCCQRTFRQLAAHMKSKHPDFVSTTESKEPSDG